MGVDSNLEGAYKYMAWDNIDKIREEFPDYSASSVIYAVLRKAGIFNSEIHKLTSKQIYSATNKVIREERQDK